MQRHSLGEPLQTLGTGARVEQVFTTRPVITGRKGGVTAGPYLPAMVPSQVDNWITALAEFGTLPLSAVLAPAIELARSGFAMTHGLRRCIGANEARFRDEWPSTAAIYLRGGRIPEWGDRFVNAD